MTQISFPDAARPGTHQAPLPPGQVESLVSLAARAPSVHNTQPWRFSARGGALELCFDASRALPVADPAGREMIISCGAALYGLRLAIRGTGYLPVVRTFPDPDQPGLLARVWLGARTPVTAAQLRLLAALPHRHTHRGAFSAQPLPPSLLPTLREEAAAEGAMLVPVDRRAADQWLAPLELAARRRQSRDPALRAETIRWTRPLGSTARDGVLARAYPAGTTPSPDAGRLPGRDFDAGRGEGAVTAGHPPAATPVLTGTVPADAELTTAGPATAVLTTTTDGPADWLRAGQALQRLLVTAASHWVFASLSSQAVEWDPARQMLRHALHLTGFPQLVLQFGRAHTAAPTPRRPVSDLLSGC